MLSFHAVTRFYIFLPRNKTALAQAIDAQPEVDYCHLDPDAWMGDGARRCGSSRDDLVHDNTRSAGLALAAVLRFDDLFSHTRETVDVAAERAVQAFQAQADLDDEEFSAVLRELFCGALHLMDACGIDLTFPPFLNLKQVLATMLFQLESLCRGAWAARLTANGTTIEDLLSDVRDDYTEQVTCLPGAPTR